MPTILVDPDEVALWRMSEPPPGFVPTPIRERTNEPIPAEAECYELHGRAHLLFANWDHAEDWSGEYVREVHPYFVLLNGYPIDEVEWRALLYRGSVNCGQK